MYVQSAEMKKTFEEALKHEKERFQVIMSGENEVLCLNIS